MKATEVESKYLIHGILFFAIEDHISFVATTYCRG
jgi:hypothetical protein